MNVEQAIAHEIEQFLQAQAGRGYARAESVTASGDDSIGKKSSAGSCPDPEGAASGVESADGASDLNLSVKVVLCECEISLAQLLSISAGSSLRLALPPSGVRVALQIASENVSYGVLTVEQEGAVIEVDRRERVDVDGQSELSHDIPCFELVDEEQSRPV